MGRELKRVPMDFDHPLNEIWPGYLSEWRDCPSDDCDNGSTIAGRYLDSIAHLLLMVGSEALRQDAMHPWLAELPLAPRKRPGRDALELSTGLAGRSPEGRLGHDSIDGWAARRKIQEAAGLPEDWGTCQVCHGNAIHPDDYEASETWEPTEPATGDGYQLWETTSEGSPISPVFATLDELCDYAAVNCSVFGASTASAEGWKHMLTDGFVASVSEAPDGTKMLFL